MKKEKFEKEIRVEIDKELENVPTILNKLCKKAYGREYEIELEELDIFYTGDYKKEVECSRMIRDGVFEKHTTLEDCAFEEAQYVSITLGIDDIDVTENYAITLDKNVIAKDIVEQVCNQLVYMME